MDKCTPLLVGAFFVGKVLGDAQFGVGGTAPTRDTTGAGLLDGFACRVTHQGAVDWVGISRNFTFIIFARLNIPSLTVKSLQSNPHLDPEREPH